MGIALPGGAPTSAQVLAALIGQTVTASQFIATVGSGSNAFQMGAGAFLQFGTSAGTLSGDGSGRPSWGINTPAQVVQNFTDGSGTTGNQTINTVRGMGAFGAGATTVTITNNQVLDATRLVIVVLLTNDGTALLKNVVPAAGSFTVNLNAATTGVTKFGWLIFS